MFLGTSWLYPNCERKLRRFGGNIPLEWLVPVNLKHVDRGRIQQYVDEDYRTYRKMYLPGTTPDGKKSRSWEWKTLDDHVAVGVPNGIYEPMPETVSPLFYGVREENKGLGGIRI